MKNEKLKIKTGDTVMVVAGKSKGHIGEVTKVFPKRNKLVVKGANMVSKHVKPSATGPGGIQKTEMPLHISNVSYYLSDSSQKTKIGYKIDEDGNKRRFAKKTGEVVS